MIDEIESGNFLKECQFKDIPEIATDKLVMSGHSIGGMTAIKAASEDKRIKFVTALDPWLLPCYKEVERGEMYIDQPV